jgi:putative transposase
MMPTPHAAPQEHKRLPRLERGAYQGRSFVHWIMTMHDRRTGWLNTSHHLQLREALLHACVRHETACALYVLMPDHGHFLLLGLGNRADQRMAVAYFRRQWNTLLPEGIRLQRQAYDHVLRENERARDAFASVAGYILQNPVRKDLVERAEDWPYAGSLVPGYATLNPHAARFWDWLWKAIEEKQAA